jgi:hypothetical protein
MFILLFIRTVYILPHYSYISQSARAFSGKEKPFNTQLGAYISIQRPGEIMEGNTDC